MKKEKDNLFLGKYQIYDALLVIGTALVILGIIFLGTVFLGTFTMGRASVIIAVILLIAGSIAIGNGKVMKKSALNEVDDFYTDYRAEKKAKKQAEKKAEENI